METLELLDWKRRVGELYAQVRAQADPRAGWERWCDVRSRLFREHPQSPVPTEQRPAYTGPHVYAYDPAWRLLAEIFPAEPQRFELPSSDGQTMAFTRFGVARVADRALELDLYWLEGYGGGLFVPFADATSGNDTYGAGRYVLGQGSRPGHGGRAPRARPQLRLPALVFLRPALDVSAGAPGEPHAAGRRGGGAADRVVRRAPAVLACARTTA